MASSSDGSLNRREKPLGRWPRQLHCILCYAIMGDHGEYSEHLNSAHEGWVVRLFHQMSAATPDTPVDCGGPLP